MALINSKYVHTNLIAKDWRKLSQFYQDIFGCVVVPPERHYKGDDLENGTGIAGAELHGVHLRLPGYGDDGPTLEIYSYGEAEPGFTHVVNRPGFRHIAFTVNNVKEARDIVLNAGGRAVGEVVDLHTSDGRKVTWCYVRDIEGNIIELQSWA